VARRVQLDEVWLSEMSAKENRRTGGKLEPAVEHECEATRDGEGKSLRVLCTYHFSVRCSGETVAEAMFKYVLEYAIEGEEPLDDGDVAQFAFANGTYHSWPFVREALFSLTARMGFPPYTLPVFRFDPKPRPKPTPPTPSASEKTGEPESPAPVRHEP
jgi:hypothetical protein